MPRFVPLRRFVPRSARSTARRLPVPVLGPVLRAVLTMSALGLAGCQSLTSVDAPDVIQGDDFATAAGATALAVGAITQFQGAFGGVYGGGGQVLVSGAMADELFATSTNPDADVSAWDSRNAKDPSPEGGVYTSLQEARQRLLSAIASFQQVAPDSSARIGQLFALLGYTSVFFGENYCAGVPLSHRDADLRPVYGQPLPTAQLFDSALTAFDSALVYGADSARIANLARVGRGRALLNQGRFAEAAQAVASVPTTYVYHATYLAIDGLNNGFFYPSLSPTTAVTVPEQEGTTGLNWRSAADPRVGLVNHSPPLVGTDSLVAFLPYQAADAPIPLAGGLEARLIEAEAALQAGDATTWLVLHNGLRADVGLGPLADPGTSEDRVDLHFRERAFWLFLTGHRHGDLRRLIRQYGRDAESVFPTGSWREGISYGGATSMALPATEGPNPHYVGCLTRDA